VLQRSLVGLAWLVTAACLVVFVLAAAQRGA
jgi:hypothetical protein